MTKEDETIDRRRRRSNIQQQTSSSSSSSSTTTLEKQITKYIPMDLWLYEYTKRLFNARYDYLVTNNGGGRRGVRGGQGEEGCTYYILPELPPLPNFIS
jgi:hypothetical protein